MRQFRPTPARPVFYGQVHFGYYQTPFTTLNLLDADIAGHRWVPRWWRGQRLKEWQHITLIHPEIICTLDLYDAKLLGVASCTIFERHTGSVIAHTRHTAQRAAIHLPEQLWRGDGFFRQPEYRLDVANRLTTGHHRVTLHITRAAQPPIRADLTLFENLDHVQPLITVLPINDHRRPLYAHKAACPVAGTLQTGDRAFTFERDTCWAVFSAQKAFYPRHAAWQSAILAGQTQDNVPVALTLTRNNIQDDARWNENALWIGNRLHMPGAARFQYDSDESNQRWHITTTDHRVELVFTPQAKHTDSARIGNIVSFERRWLCGTFRGTIIDDGDNSHTVEDAGGIIERHTLKA